MMDARACNEVTRLCGLQQLAALEQLGAYERQDDQVVLRRAGGRDTASALPAGVGRVHTHAVAHEESRAPRRCCGAHQRLLDVLQATNGVEGDADVVRVDDVAGDDLRRAAWWACDRAA
jgi:hypothetical protein